MGSDERTVKEWLSSKFHLKLIPPNFRKYWKWDLYLALGLFVCVQVLGNIVHRSTDAPLPRTGIEVGVSDWSPTRDVRSTSVGPLTKVEGRAAWAVCSSGVGRPRRGLVLGSSTGNDLPEELMNAIGDAKEPYYVVQLDACWALGAER